MIIIEIKLKCDKHHSFDMSYIYYLLYNYYKYKFVVKYILEKIETLFFIFIIIFNKNKEIIFQSFFKILV